MKLTIRERCEKVAEYIKDNGFETIKAIAAATGLSKSSVQRHRKAIERHNLHPESLWWETSVGSGWLKLFVLAVVYYFGIKRGIGSESLSEFFQAIRLGGHVGTSASALRQLENQMQQAIIAYLTSCTLRVNTETNKLA